MQAWGTGTLLKRDSNAGVFLRILRNFNEHLLWRSSGNDCFWIGSTDFLLMRFWSFPSRCIGISPFSSVDLFIRVLLLGYRLFYREKSDANPPLFTSNILTSTWFSTLLLQSFAKSRQDSQSSYGFDKIQNVGETEHFEEKYLLFHWRKISYLVFKNIFR